MDEFGNVKKNLLSKYDEEIGEEKRSSFVIGEYFIIASNVPAKLSTPDASRETEFCGNMFLVHQVVLVDAVHMNYSIKDTNTFRRAWNPP